MYRKKQKKAQSTLEVSILIAVIAMALLAMLVYMKRGLQGKYRQIADDVGEQYSPTKMNSDLTTTTDNTIIKTIEKDEQAIPTDPLTYNVKTDETTNRTGFEEMFSHDGSEPFF